MPASVVPSDRGRSVLDAGVVAGLRAVLAEGILPGATDTAASVSTETLAAWVDLLGEVEKVKHTVAAVQARVVVALDEATRASEEKQGIRKERRGRGVPSQVGAAMGQSPNAGASFLGDARVWVQQMPRTFEALRAGALGEWRARIMVRETSHLSAEHRAMIDEQVCGDLRVLAGLGGKRLTARVKELASKLDVHACVKRLAKAESERCVSVRPAPDLMVYLTALVPMKQGIQAYAQLRAHADALKGTGDERSGGQIMADTLIERVTGRDKADQVPVTVNLLVSDETLLAGGSDPGGTAGGFRRRCWLGARAGGAGAGRSGHGCGRRMAARDLRGSSGAAAGYYEHVAVLPGRDHEPAAGSAAGCVCHSVLRCAGAARRPRCSARPGRSHEPGQRARGMRAVQSRQAGAGLVAVRAAAGSSGR
jgi:hypothetical protein